MDGRKILRKLIFSFYFVHNNISSFFCLRKSLFCDVRCTINCMHHMHVTIRMFFKLQNRSTTSLLVVRTSLLHFSRRTRKTRPSNSFIYCMHACTSHTPSGVTITKISDKTKQNRRINPFLLTQSNVRLPEVERKLDVIVAIERRDG